MISYKPFRTRLGCLVERKFTLAQNGAIHEHVSLSGPEVLLGPSERFRLQSAPPTHPGVRSP